MVSELSHSPLICIRKQHRLVGKFGFLNKIDYICICLLFQTIAMDIVSRLKTFISSLAIPVTQFADNCKIARPTLSQLLNGRNKKVSDELIGKIHEAYPELSVLWLMFGEGNMRYTNPEISITATAQNQNSIFDFEHDSPIPPKEEKETPRIDFNYNIVDGDSDSFLQDEVDKAATYDTTTQFSRDNESNNTSDENVQKIEAQAYRSNTSRKIVNIIIYYSDNSFESFVPNNKQD